jgi:hypothetical protein
MLNLAQSAMDNVTPLSGVTRKDFAADVCPEKIFSSLSLSCLPPFTLSLFVTIIS